MAKILLRLREKIRRRAMPETAQGTGSYLNKTTSHQKTVAKGMTPEKVGKALATRALKKHLAETSKGSRHIGRVTKRRKSQRRRLV